MGTVAQLNASPPDQVRSDVAAIINKIVTTSYYKSVKLFSSARAKMPFYPVS